jgi:hypothetical protein
MSMTREEAIKLLKQYQGYEPMSPDGETLKHSFDLTDETVDTLLTALRPVSREQVEQMRSRWVPLNNTQEHFCESCGVAFNLYAYCKNDYQFCPACGAPMTDEAVEMVMERLEATRSGKERLP